MIALGLFIVLIFGMGFAAGYGARSFVSHKRRMREQPTDVHW